MVDVISFSPLKEIQVNGKKQKLEMNREIQFSIPFDLATTPDKKLNFKITVLTESGKAEKEFNLYHGIKPIEEESKFNIITIFGITQTDNVNSSENDKKRATKKVLTLVPTYSIPFQGASQLTVKGIILRESYNGKDYSDKEAAYTQVATRWTKKKQLADQFYIEAGYSDIHMDNRNLLNGDEQSYNERFALIGLSGKIQKNLKWKSEVKYNDKNTAKAAKNINYDSDATEISILGDIAFPVKGVKACLGLKFTDNDAEGKYYDSSTWMSELKAKYPYGNWRPELRYKIENKTLKEKDPNKNNKQPKEIQYTTVAKLQYKIMKTLFASLQYKRKHQLSNVSDADYQSHITSFSLTHIF